MRFTIMQRSVGFRRDETAPEDLIGGQEGVLLRLLTLRRGHSSTREEIAHHLSHFGRHTVNPNSVPAYVQRLRTRIGPDVVRSNAGEYSFGLDQAEVDAFVFEHLIGQYHVADVTDVDDEENDYRDSYDELLELHAMWHGHPAQQFEDEQDDEILLGRYRDFQRYWDCLNRCIIYSELRSHRKPRIEKAIARIEQLLRQDPADEQLLTLLYRARASLPGHNGSLAALDEQIRRQFPGRIPSELGYTIKRITDGHRDALFPIDQRRRLPADQQKVDKLIQTIGISAASELELRQSSLEPSECIRQTVSRLCFAGILATKWMADSYVRSRFARLLDRLDEQGGSVRFLLLNPASEAFTRFSELRWSDGDTQSIERLQTLSAAHPCFEVRLYETLPSFRIVIIDQGIVTFSPYLMARGTERASSGWEAPHIVLDQTAPWPLAQTFKTLFEETWRTAKPLGGLGRVL